jgi:predicted metal-dependent peptidase
MSLRNFDTLFEELSDEEFKAIVNKPATPERIAEYTKKIYAAKILLQRKGPLFGLVVSQMRIIPTVKMDTMAVDDFGNLYINPNFALDVLSLNETAGVLAHEAFHIINGTFARRKDRIHKIWNWATDFVMNRDLLWDGWELPSLGLIPKRNGDSWTIDVPKMDISNYDITSLTAEQLYDYLASKWPKNDGKNKGKGEPGEGGEGDGEPSEGGEGDGEEGDDPGAPGKSKGKGKGKPSNKKGASGGEPDDKFDDHLENGEKLDPAEEWGGDSPAGEKLTKEQKREIMERIVRDAQKAAENMAAGQGGGAPRGVDMSRLNYTVRNWKTLLRQFVTQATSVRPDYMRPSIKHAAAGYYQPKMRVEREKVDICIAVDTSGSVSEDVLRVFLAEIGGLIDSFGEIRVRVILWHTEVYWDQILEKSPGKGRDLKEVLRTAPFEGGGTDFNSVVEALGKSKETENVLVVFTDGHFSRTPTPKTKKGSNGIFFMLQEPGGSTEVIKTMSNNIFHVEVPKS